MDFVKFYSNEKWKGLTNLTRMHNRISALTYSILLNAKMIPTWLEEEDIEIDKFNLFGEEYTIDDVKPEGYGIAKKKELLFCSHLADKIDKGIIERRLNHANVFGNEWIPNFRNKHKQIIEDIRNGKDIESILLETAYNVHYLQDALSVMHTHAYFQEHHIEFEHYINDNYFKIAPYDNIVYHLRRNFVYVRDVDSLINWIGTKRKVAGYAGLRAVADYINRQYATGYKVVEKSMEHGVALDIALSVIATFNYYLIILDYIR